jgi:hypothetical protein
MKRRGFTMELPQTNPFVRDERPRGPTRWIPALAAVRTYQRAWLPKDIVAGLVLTAILVPVGMGYAEAAGLLGFASPQPTTASQESPNWCFCVYICS